MAYFDPFNKKTVAWDRESDDVSNFSDDIVMPRYSRNQEPFVETPQYETGRGESLKSCIETYKKIATRLKTEQDAKKRRKCEQILASTKRILLNNADYISNIMKISLDKMFQEYTK